MYFLEYAKLLSIINKSAHRVPFTGLIKIKIYFEKEQLCEEPVATSVLLMTNFEGKLQTHLRKHCASTDLNFFY